MKKLESIIAFREGKRSGDIRKVINHLKDILAEERSEHLRGPLLHKLLSDIYKRAVEIKTQRRKRVENAVKRFAK